MSAPGRMECPHCRQSIKRPSLAPGEKCLCPKCNQPFLLNAAGEGVIDVPPARPKPPAPSAPVATNPPSQPSPPQQAKPVAKPDAPPPAKPAEIPLHCFLCGSLLYARVSQIGGKIQCPDCHAENEVREPKPASIDSSDKPSLDDVEEFRLSEPVERPQFSPIERLPIGDDEIPLAPIPVAPTERPLPTPTSPAGAATPPTTSPLAGSAPPPRRYRKREESYGDELWDDTGPYAHLPPHQRSPFLAGIVEFLIYPGTIGRWLALTALAMVPIAFIELAAASASREELFTSGSILWGCFAFITGLTWAVLFSAHMIAIVDDTGNGLDVIENWPLVGQFPRSNPLYLAAAMAPVTFASLLLSLLLVAGSWIDLGPIAMLVIGKLLLPLAWLPMLLEKSFAAPVQSRVFWESFRDSGDGWFVFAFETLMLGLPAAIGVSLWNHGSLILTPLSAALIVTSLFVYTRILGRLLWYINPEMIPPPPPPPQSGPPPLPDTVDPLQLHR